MKWQTGALPYRLDQGGTYAKGTWVCWAAGDHRRRLLRGCGQLNKRRLRAKGHRPDGAAWTESAGRTRLSSALQGRFKIESPAFHQDGFWSETGRGRLFFLNDAGSAFDISYRVELAGAG